MLKMSTLFLRTLRDDPADAEVASHKLLVRAGYVRRIAAGIYSWLPLGVITLRNVERVIREEMDNAGFQEVNFPALLPREAYETTNRWEEYGPSLAFKRLIFLHYFHVKLMKQPTAGKSTAHHCFVCKIARVGITY